MNTQQSHIQFQVNTLSCRMKACFVLKRTGGGGRMHFVPALSCKTRYLPNSKMADELRQMLIHGSFLFEDLCRFRFLSDDFTFRILKIRVSEFVILLCAVYTAFSHIEAVRNLVPEMIVAFKIELEKFSTIALNNSVSTRAEMKLLFKALQEPELLGDLGW